MRPPIRLLGPIEVEVGNRPADLGPARQRAVLAVLMLAAGHPVQCDDLLSRVWGFDSPPAARQALRTYICRLRQAVGGSGLLHIERASGGYVAVADPDLLDLFRFRRLVADARAAGRAGDSDGALTGLTEALALWPGSALAGCTRRGWMMCARLWPRSD
jgi:DNA-binding SARP family transcriptional activator